jgi:3-methyl-2-oxobutanoate hydroxymethyltransferase
MNENLGSQRYTKITTHVLQEMKLKDEKIAMLTAYDYSMAGILDAAGIDVILVGDSASNVMAGYTTTLPITLDEMIYHASSVVRAVQRALVVVDLPFGTYQGNSKKALASAIRIMKESGADAIKIEGGKEIIDSVERILSAGIPVMGHLGLTPQSIHKFGTYVVRAKEEAEANKLKDDAQLLEKAGCFAIVLEKIPATLGAEVTQLVKCPIIGIGAGSGVDGQVLVLHDMLGITTKFSPRFLRRYHNLYEEIKGAVQTNIEDVKNLDFLMPVNNTEIPMIVIYGKVIHLSQRILYEDNHLLVINKLPGEIVQGDKTGDKPLVETAKDYIAQKYHKPGEVFLGVVHRLDRPVSGAIILARTSKPSNALMLCSKKENPKNLLGYC